MLDNIKSIEELYEYMDNNIKYGWVGIDNKVRIDSLKEFKEYYRTMTIEDIIKYGVGTCPDQVNLVKYYLDKNNIENKILVLTGYEEVDNVLKERVHFMIFYCIDNIWYQFELASRFFKGIFKYDNNDFDTIIKNKYKEILKNIVVLELDKIDSGLEYDSLRKIILDKLTNN